MDRRSFMNRSVAASAGLALTSPWLAAKPSLVIPSHNFKLLYAPHFGMFKNSAGEDRLDQLQFMHDVGFRALEYNGLMDQSVDFQEQLGAKLQELDMTMGVFVILTGEHWMTSLTTGQAKFVNNFVKTCERAVAVAARVNARWMTVVPGFYDR
ncbi:MAG: xylose isomerase, partial [Bacteroidetes bacterium]